MWQVFVDATTEAALPAGARLGDYVVAGEIAAGGMGVVYLAARDDDLDRGLYAIKVIHDDLARRFPELGDLLRHEAHLAGHIHHPNAVGVLEIGEQDARPYVVMPYVEGGTLADLIAAGRASPPVVVAVMLDALRGLHAAHVAEDDRGRPLRLVHRDVCPDNILIGIDGMARIADFGVAVAASHTLDADRGSGRGKWAFMSPEQLRGEPVDRRSDVFSTGVTLVAALTGCELFRGDSVTATMQNVLSMPVPAPSELGAKPPPELDALCLRALERDPASRFPSAEAMAAALSEAAGSASLVASIEEVGREVQAAVGAALEARREALAALSRRSSPRSLPLPPPNPSDSAAETLRPDEAARLAAELADAEDDDDDPDGPSTAVYQPGEHGELADLEIVVEGDGGPAREATAVGATNPPLAAGGGPIDRSTMDLDPSDLLDADGDGAADAREMASGTPPAGSASIDPTGAEAGEPDLASVNIRPAGRLAALWRRLWRALRPRRG